MRYLLILIAVMVTSCQTGAMKVRLITPKQTKEIEVKQPANAKEPAIVEIKEDGTIHLQNSSSYQGATYTEKATTNWLMILGGLFAVLAVAGFVARSYLPLIPSNAPMGLSVASVACFMMPTVLDKYLLPILIGGAVWLAWVYYSYRHNHKLKKAHPEGQA